MTDEQNLDVAEVKPRALRSCEIKAQRFQIAVDEDVAFRRDDE